MQDITYLPCLEGTFYLNAIMDLYNGEVVAWKISKHPDTQLALDSLELLVEKLSGKTEGVILHSDRGSSYTSCAYRARVEELGMRISLGSKASQQAPHARRVVSARWALAMTTPGWNPSMALSRQKPSTALLTSQK